MQANADAVGQGLGTRALSYPKSHGVGRRARWVGL